MDTVDGRYLLNALASYYTIPYFDIGVRLDAVRDGGDRGRIREICGTVNYLRPGRSSLVSRGLFTWPMSRRRAFAGTTLPPMRGRSRTVTPRACPRTARP